MGLCLISIREVQQYQRRWNALILDLRDADAYAKWHISGAENVPVERLESFMKHIPKEKVLIFYCEHGNTSIQEGCRYVKQGYRICSVAGGIGER